MGGEAVVIIPSFVNNMTGASYNDDISDLESSTEDHMGQPEQRHKLEPDDDDSDTDEEEEEDCFPDFPPNFDLQSKSIPPHFLCPLTKSIMIHPVIDAEGNTYERRAIMRWLDLEDISPVTGNPLSPIDLVENKRRMAAIEKYREEVWSAYATNDGDAKDETLFKREKRIDHKEKQRQMRKEMRKSLKGSKRKEHEMLTDKSTKLLMQMQEELDMLQEQNQEDTEMHKHWLDDMHNNEKKEDSDDHVEYLLRKKKEEEAMPKSAVMDRIRSKHRDSHRHSGTGEIPNTAIVRKQSSRSPHVEVKNDPPSNTALVTRKSSSRRHLDLNKQSSRKSLSPEIDTSEPNHKPNAHRNSLESSYSSLQQQNNTGSKSPHCERKSTRQLQDPDIKSSIKSLELVQNIPAPPIAGPGPERKSSRRLVRDPAVSTSMKSMSSQGSKKVSPAPPPRLNKSDSNGHSTHSSNHKSSNAHDRHSKDQNKSSITERIIAEVNGSDTSPLNRAPSSKAMPTTASTTSESQQSDARRDHGWSVPIGVHKVICDAPGLLVTCDVHRRSAPVKRETGPSDEAPSRSRRKLSSDQHVVVPPGAYIEVVETQIHGDRVRGRIVWEETVVEAVDETHKSRKLSLRSLGKLTHKKNKVASSKDTEVATHTVTHRYTGWVSLRWAGDKDQSNPGKDGHGSRHAKATDEDAGPWTEPVSLGCYCISFSSGLPVRSSPDRNSSLVGMLEKGQYVEVVETQVKGDRVRARCISISKGDKAPNGWISLFNAVTGSSGAYAVPLGAYVAVTEGGCSVTEGGSFDSKFKCLLKRGSCVEIVATRIEDNAVRGLVSTGGYVTLIGPKKSSKKNGKSSSSKDEQYLMHVPIGVYKVVYPDGLPVFMGIQSDSPSAFDLEAESMVQVVETCVQNGRVCGRIISVINGNARHELHGWIYLFESKRRWCKFAFS